MLALLFACTPTPETGVPQTDERLKVVIVVMDGLRLEESLGAMESDLTGELPQALLPRIHSELVPLGTLIRPAWQTGPTSTGPGHVQLTTGRRVVYGQYPPDDEDNTGEFVPEVPTIFQALAGEDPSLMVGNTYHVRSAAHTLYPGATGQPVWQRVVTDEGYLSPNDMDVVQVLVDAMDAEEPVLSLLNLHYADTIAHQSDESADYLDATAAQDEVVMRVWEAIGKRPRYADQTLLVVTTDHGRHREGDLGWMEHGDSCSGCREVPILLIGPGVAAGQILDTPHALIDIAPTLAALTGAELPFADGLPITAALDGITATARTGLTEPVTNGTAEAWVVYQDTPLARTAVVYDGQIVSDPTAFEARDPVLFSLDDAQGLCWRELTVSDGVPGAWVERCQFGGQDIGFPFEEVGPFARPAIAQSGDQLLAVYNRDPGGRAADTNREPISVGMARWTAAAGWEEAPAPMHSYFPVNPALAVLDDGAFVAAYAGSEDGSDGRYDRRIFLHRGQWDAALTVEDGLTLDLSAVGNFTRQERPTLHRDAAGITVALMACGPESCGVVTATSTDDGASWEAPILHDLGVAPHISPTFSPDGTLHWARTDAVCSPGGCQDVGRRIGGLAASDDAVMVVVDAGVGQWALRRIAD